MKKLLILFAVPLFAFITADWVTAKIDDRVSVDFPFQPEKKDLNGNPVWQIDANVNARCMVMVFDFHSVGLDSAGLVAEMTKPTAQEEFKTGTLGQMPGSSIISEGHGLTAGKTTFDFVFDMGKKDTAQFNIMHNKNIFAGTKMYTLSFFEKTGKPQEALRKKFFGSLRVKY